MPFVKVGECVHHYVIEGEEHRPALIFSNSLGSDLRIWDPVVPYLPQEVRLLRYDTRGHGLSESLPPPYSMRDLAGDVAGLMDALGIQQAVVCGLSVGGVIAQQLAIDYPDRVRALILLDTGLRIGTTAGWDERIAIVRTQGMAALAKPSMERWFSAEFRRRRSADVRGYANMVSRTASDGYMGTCCALRDTDLGQTARAINKPTLVLCGEEDIATPPELARQLAAVIPNAALSLLTGAAHISCVEQPAMVATRITDFLREVNVV